MLATGVVGAVEDPWIRWSWISGHADVILSALLQHIQLTLIAVVIGLAIAVPLGLVAWRSRLFRGPIFSLTGILYTIPSLALFAFLTLYGRGDLMPAWFQPMFVPLLFIALGLYLLLEKRTT